MFEGLNPFRTEEKIYCNFKNNLELFANNSGSSCEKKKKSFTTTSKCAALPKGCMILVCTHFFPSVSTASCFYMHCAGQEQACGHMFVHTDVTFSHEHS